jgi:ribose transport system substrate-binding protein
MGYLGVKTMVEHLQGRSVPAVVDTGCSFVTRTDLDDPNVRARVLPDLTPWLSGG